jgi:hypothetical protein
MIEFPFSSYFNHHIIHPSLFTQLKVPRECGCVVWIDEQDQFNCGKLKVCWFFKMPTKFPLLLAAAASISVSTAM